MTLELQVSNHVDLPVQEASVTFIFVHGAWHGAWCWAPLQERLNALGFASTAIDLPGHGTRRALGWRTSWQDYIEAVRDAVAAQPTPPIVVGHSMAGGVITGAAELAPDLFAGLVYVTAVVPQTRERILGLARQNSRMPGYLPMPGLRIRLLSGESVLDPEAARDYLYQDCPEPMAWVKQMQPEPLRPGFARMKVSVEGAGRLPRYYIRCLRDRALTLGFQDAMAARAPMRRTFDLDAGHSPFVAKPAELAAILAEIAAEMLPARSS